jgi:hypothetical protein
MRIPLPLAQIQPNRAHPALPLLRRASALRWNGRRMAEGAAKTPFNCGVLLGVFPLFFAAVKRYRIPPPLARNQPNRAHPELPILWRASALRWNGRRMATGVSKSPFGCGVLLGVFPLFFAAVKRYRIPPPSLEINPTERTRRRPYCGGQAHCAGTGAGGPWVGAETLSDNAAVVAKIRRFLPR